MKLNFDIKCSDYTNTPAYRVFVNGELMLERDFVIPSTEFSHYNFTGFIDSETASVSEVFAETLKELKGTPILGEASSGQVVMAIWYRLDALGPGYSLSIPEAFYISPKGETIEGVGIWPKRLLNYRLNSEVQGKDSWLEAIGYRL